MSPDLSPNDPFVMNSKSSLSRLFLVRVILAVLVSLVAIGGLVYTWFMAFSYGMGMGVFSSDDYRRFELIAVPVTYASLPVAIASVVLAILVVQKGWALWLLGLVCLMAAACPVSYYFATLLLYGW